MKYQKGTFLIIPNKESLRGLKPVTQAVYLWICNYSNEFGECFPSRKKLSEDVGVTFKPVDSALKELEDIGLITKIVRKNGKENLTNIYQVNIVEYTPPYVNSPLGSGENDPTPSGDIPLGSGELYTVTQYNNSIQDNSSRLSDESEESFDDWMYNKGYRQEPSNKEVNECYPMVWWGESEFGAQNELRRAELLKLKKEYQAGKKTPPGASEAQKTLSPQEVVGLWNNFTTLGENGVPQKAMNPSCEVVGILPEARVTPDINSQIKKHSYKYKEKEMWELAFKNYAKEIMARWEDDKGYFRHRMSLYEFLLQKNGFTKYVNK